MEKTIMKKSDLITALAIKEDMSEKKATEIINLIFDGFTDSLKKGDSIEVRGFGRFSVREYKSFKGRNPKTGERVDVKPKKLPFFKVGRDLKGMVLNTLKK
jgi:integration host factor subunit beta